MFDSVKSTLFSFVLVLFLTRFAFVMAAKDIEFQELKHLLEEHSVTLLDVRTRQELKNDGSFPYSSVINIPIDELSEALKQDENDFRMKYGANKPRPDDAIVFSCRSGRRAALAQQSAEELGYKNSRLYRGSFNDWIEKGGPFNKE